MIKTELRTIFSTNLKRYLKIKKINRKELSNQLDIAYSRICDWSRARTLPTSDELLKIATFFDISVDKLTKDIELPHVDIENNLSFNDEHKKVRIYDITSGDVIGHDEVCYEYLNNIDEVHISFLIDDDSMTPKYSINDLVLVEHIWKVKELEEGDYLITQNNSNAKFIHIYNKNDCYLIAPLNINNSKCIMPFEIKKENIKDYDIYKAVAVTKKL